MKGPCAGRCWSSQTARELADRHRNDVSHRGDPRASCGTPTASGRIALVLALEGLEPVGADLPVLDAFFRLGVRIASLTWNRRTQLADGAGRTTPVGR